MSALEMKILRGCALKRRGFVYFITSPAMSAVKIGFSSSHPRTRLAALQTGNPDELQLLGFYEAAIDEEQKWHTRFATYRIRGEWFRREGDFADFVSAFLEKYWAECPEREVA